MSQGAIMMKHSSCPETSLLFSPHIRVSYAINTISILGRSQTHRINGAPGPQIPGNSDHISTVWHHAARLVGFSTPRSHAPSQDSRGRTATQSDAIINPPSVTDRLISSISASRPFSDVIRVPSANTKGPLLIATCDIVFKVRM
jgi:hypothetical protein